MNLEEHVQNCPSFTKMAHALNVVPDYKSGTLIKSWSMCKTSKRINLALIHQEDGY